MINTNKKIHIYNRFRTIYTSKNRYYIRHNKKYIDIYAIIKNANHNSIQPSQQRGGAAKNENTFLLPELNAIKNSIVIFKLLIDDKQSEAINIYINLIELINSKRELIINKINTYPLNHFDNELNKAAIITYVKNMLYNNIFNNYLINIIPRIDIYDNIKEANKEYNTDVFEYIIKSLLHFDDKGDKEVLEGIMKKIEKYKDVLKKSIIANCTNHKKLKEMIGKSIEVAKQEVEEAKNEQEEEDETAVEEAGATVEAGAATGAGADTGAEAGAGAGATTATGADAETGAGKTENNKSNGSNESEIQKVINEEMEAIKEGLENLENKDYVDRLLPFLEKEFEYYEFFINNDDKGINNSELEKFFSNIDNFLKRYKILYVGYIAYNDKEKNEKKEILDEKNNKFEKTQKKIKVIEKNLKDLKNNLDEIQEKIDFLIKEADEKGLEPDEDTDKGTDEDTTQGTDASLMNGGRRGSRRGSRRGCKQKFISIRGGEGEQGEDGGQGGKEGDEAEEGQGKVGEDGKEDGKEKVGEDGGEGEEEAKAKAEAKEKEKEERENKKKELEKERESIKNEYSVNIKHIRVLKIELNALKKEIAKITKKIEAIEKKNKQYREFLEKIQQLIAKIAAKKIDSKKTQKNDDINNYTNLTLYRNYIENIIFNIKSKILYYFIINYIRFCIDLNENKETNKDKNFKELKENIDKLYEEEQLETDKDPEGAAGAADVAGAAGVAGADGKGAQVPEGTAQVPEGAKEAGGFKGGRANRGVGVCAYLTDVEGNLDFFEKYVRISKVIEWVDSKKNRLRFKQNDSMFVFGGDCQDRGIGDIRFVNLLLNFKSEYPNRVEFIIGNRDANKIRISSELSEKIYATGVADRKAESKYLAKYDNFPYWVNKSERITLRTYLNDNNFKIDAVSRLKYILDYTMGSNDSFDKRRKELSIILNKSPDLISDNDIVASFLNSVSPNPKNIKNTNDNYMLKYLKSGKIAYIFGEHIFVHGAINKNNIGYIPNNKNIVDDVDKWVSGLNKWFQKDLKEYMANPEYGGISKKRKGYKIIDYAVPSDNKTVVYSDNLKNGNGQYINAKVIKYLNKGGIHSIISGHRPHGDCPLVLRSKKLTAVSADTSYSKKGHRSKWGIDNRGNAVSEVLLYLNGDIQIHGILQDNQKYDYIIKNKEIKPTVPVVPVKPAKTAPKYDKYIGLQLKNNYWVKNVKYDKNSKNSKYLISHAKGFEYDDKWITETDMLKLL